MSYAIEVARFYLWAMVYLLWNGSGGDDDDDVRCDGSAGNGPDTSTAGNNGESIGAAESNS